MGLFYLIYLRIACSVGVYLAAGPFKVRASLLNQNVSLPPTPKPPPKSLFVRQDIATAPLSRLNNTVPHIIHFVYRSHWNREWVQYQHWPIKRAITLDEKGLQWRIVAHIFQTKLIHKYRFDVWLTVHLSSMWNKKPSRCHLVLYLFLLYKLLNMFRMLIHPSSGACDLF